MRVFYTDESFNLGNQSYPGLPFLIADTGFPVLPVNNFLIYIATVRGKTRSPRTWRNYADHLYDYFTYLEVNKLMWDNEFSQTHPLVQWRNWSLSRRTEDGFRAISDETINLRLSTVCRFYEWASKDGWGIESLPFKIDLVKTGSRQNSSMLSHISPNLGMPSNNLTLRLFTKPPKTASLEDCRTFITYGLRSEQDRLVALLMLQCGLRRSEAISIPAKYIVDPVHLDSSKLINVSLSPRDMELKYNKARDVFVSPALMAKLWRFKVLDRNKRAIKFKQEYGKDSSRLFLSRSGSELPGASVTEKFREARGRTSLKIHPHMLRHTFATQELYALMKKMNQGNALLWVKERLGHAQLQTTMIYLHLVETIEFTALDDFQNQIDTILESEHGR